MKNKQVPQSQNSSKIYQQIIETEAKSKTKIDTITFIYLIAYFLGSNMDCNKRRQC